MENDAEINHVFENLKSINRDLDILNKEDKPRLLEKIFVGVFIPIFAGEESQYNATIETWIMFAGTPYISVDIVNDFGKVIFTVPPIFDRENVNVDNGNNNIPILEIVKRADQFARVHPNQGKQYLNNELSKKATLLKLSANIIKNLEFWNTTFKKYGKPEIVIEKKDTDTNTNPILDNYDIEEL